MSPVSVTATPEPDRARVRVETSGGDSGGVLYLFRRDGGGVEVVRDTSAGTVLWPPAGQQLAHVNLIDGGDFTDVDANGAVVGLVPGEGGRVTRDALHPVAGGAGWSLRIRWGGERYYPAVNRYPSPASYPSEPGAPEPGTFRETFTENY